MVMLKAAKKPVPKSGNKALYDKLIATIPEIERKGDANPYTSLNDNVFTLLHQSKLRAAGNNEDGCSPPDGRGGRPSISRRNFPSRSRFQRTENGQG